MAPFVAPIRLAAFPDLASVTVCVDAAFQPYAARIGKPPSPMLADYPSLIKRGRVHLLEAEGRVAGVLVSEAQRDHLFIDILAVDPAVRRAGAGRRLMDFAEDEARRSGLFRVRLYTHAVMAEARAFYQALGYAEVGARHEAGYDRVYLEKVIEATH